MRGNSNRLYHNLKQPLSLLLLASSCVFLGGCPSMHVGREFLKYGTFNQAYLKRCEQVDEAGAVDKTRLIHAYTALFYMDAEVASQAVREVAEVQPEYGIKPFPAVDSSAAFVAMQRLIPLHIDEENWPALLAMLKEHKSLLLMATDDKPLETVVVALEGIHSHIQYNQDISELTQFVASQVQTLPNAKATKRQELLGRLSKLAGRQ